MTLSVAEVLVLRYQFDEITKNFTMQKGSDINNINRFIEEGYKSNSLRRGYKKALELANKIRGNYAEETRERFKV